jgi:fibronectin type 3 domain-containing protein
VLTLQKPLNINWTTHADESLFQTRYVTEVTWERNPANDALGVQIVLYRIYRKKISESDKAYRVIGEVTGDTYRYLDKDAGGNNIYSYTVTGLDNMGHESPLSGAAGFFSNPLLDKQPKGTERQGQILKF